MDTTHIAALVDATCAQILHDEFELAKPLGDWAACASFMVEYSVPVSGDGQLLALHSSLTATGWLVPNEHHALKGGVSSPKVVAICVNVLDELDAVVCEAEVEWYVSPSV